MTHGESASWRLPPVLLPEGEARDLWVAGGRITSVAVAGATPLPGRYVLPGLVDAHGHLALDGHGGTRDLEGIGDALEEQARRGVLLVRDVGAPAGRTLDVEAGPYRSRLLAAGRWLAPSGRFFPALHDPIAADDLIAAALAEVARGARWVKVVADWTTPELSYDEATLRRLVGAVHAAGARVAAHVTREGVPAVVAAGADSIEHGCLLDRGTLEVMAARGVAWTPTITAIAAALPDDAPAGARHRQRDRLDNLRALLAPAAALGVTILAGTDAAGSLADEVSRLVDFGLAPVDALRAATTRARAFLGAPALDDGAPADVATFHADPRSDPTVLGHPAAVVLGGRRVA